MRNNKVKYNNGFYETGRINKKFRKLFPTTPICDTVYFRLRQKKTGKVKGISELFTFTYDEFAALAMLITETVWYNIPTQPRSKKGFVSKK